MFQPALPANKKNPNHRLVTNSRRPVSLETAPDVTAAVTAIADEAKEAMPRLPISSAPPSRLVKHLRRLRIASVSSVRGKAASVPDRVVSVPSNPKVRRRNVRHADRCLTAAARVVSM